MRTSSIEIYIIYEQTNIIITRISRIQMIVIIDWLLKNSHAGSCLFIFIIITVFYACSRLEVIDLD